MKELRKMQDCVKEVRDLESSYEDINALIELTEEEEDREMIKEIQREIVKFEKEFEDLRIRTLLSGEYDSCNAIVTLHAGAGGTDSCDWANMLYRMYTRYAQSKGFQITVLDYQDGDITGLIMHMAIFSQKRECTVWCVFLRSIQQARGRHLLHPVM